MARSNEPMMWALFSSGGMIAALTFPAIVMILWIAVPLGWVELPASQLAGRMSPWIVRAVVFAIVSLALFHWAHRFRYTLYDGLQLSHLYGLIATICYGGATVLTLVAAYVLFTF